MCSISIVTSSDPRSRDNSTDQSIHRFISEQDDYSLLYQNRKALQTIFNRHKRPEQSNSITLFEFLHICKSLAICPDLVSVRALLTLLSTAKSELKPHLKNIQSLVEKAASYDLTYDQFEYAYPSNQPLRKRVQRFLAGIRPHALAAYRVDLVLHHHGTGRRILAENCQSSMADYGFKDCCCGEYEQVPAAEERRNYSSKLVKKLRRDAHLQQVVTVYSTPCTTLYSPPIVVAQDQTGSHHTQRYQAKSHTVSPRRKKPSPPPGLPPVMSRGDFRRPRIDTSLTIPRRGKSVAGNGPSRSYATIDPAELRSGDKADIVGIYGESQRRRQSEIKAGSQNSSMRTSPTSSIVRSSNGSPSRPPVNSVQVRRRLVMSKAGRGKGKREALNRSADAALEGPDKEVRQFLDGMRGCIRRFVERQSEIARRYKGQRETEPETGTNQSENALRVVEELRVQLGEMTAEKLRLEQEVALLKGTCVAQPNV